MTSDPFAQAVRFYELDEGQFVDDLGLYVGLAGHWGGPVLELGCGTGRVLRALAAAGISATGVDRSEAMLQAAADRLASTNHGSGIRLVRGDMRDFEFEEPFAWAILAMNSLMHLTTLEAQYAALAHIRAAVRGGGHLVLDLANPDPDWLLDPGERIVRVGVLTDPQTGRTVIRQVIQRSDPLRQILSLVYVYDEIGTNGDVHRVLCPMRLRYVFPFEARLLLEKAGFQVEEVYGTYDMDPFGGTDERMILICSAK